ncbi:helix-hairpin-helix domain-containing protein [Pinibacter aurantiacus]|uniref:Helix-hairpin-helix domain-containing protein n=1 Tax=Pinibacter aurantiacus TaxID=2851599 RepID=A0A9E2W7E7_9BACT|nr:helix-hairpin-helix domain-containing protein [Pinibacter aurantiacus]MBV4356536.1 helix-hairpin-helix domain-containing protein [Pinibacter aurantiacus]
MPFTNKKWWKDYFSFTKKERIGVIVLLIIVVIVFLLPAFFSNPGPPDDAVVKDFKEQVAKLQTKKETRSDYNSHYEKKDYRDFNNDKTPTHGELFYFDPNTASQSDWQRLGLNEKNIHTILNYVSKGGKFRKPEDLLKIYSLREADAQRLIPYVRIDDAETYKTDMHKDRVATKSEKKLSIIDVNSADTNLLKSLQGIGSKLPQRIVNFREKLGGFSDVSQIAETYRLPDSTFQKISSYLTVGKGGIKQININVATANDLKQHPYIGWKIANAIVQYRSQHNEFQSIEDLRKIALISEDDYKKIYPYVSIK